MVITQIMDKLLVHLRSFFKKMGFLPSTLYLVLQIIMVWMKDETKLCMSNTKLPQYLWTEALKTIVYILKRVPTKVVSKTPFELFKGWKPCLRHIRVLGCPS